MKRRKENPLLPFSSSLFPTAYCLLPTACFSRMPVGIGPGENVAGILEGPGDGAGMRAAHTGNSGKAIRAFAPGPFDSDLDGGRDVGRMHAVGGMQCLCDVAVNVGPDRFRWIEFAGGPASSPLGRGGERMGKEAACLLTERFIAGHIGQGNAE